MYLSRELTALFFVVVSYRQLVKWEMMPEIKRAKIWIYQLFFPSWNFFLTALPFSRLLLLEESKMSGKATSAPWLPPTKDLTNKKHSYSMAHLISCFALSCCTSFGLVPSVGALTCEGLGWRGQRWRRGRKKRNLPTHELCSHAKRGDGSSTLPHRKTWTSILKGGYQVFLPLFHTPTPHFSRKGERFTGLLHIIANLWTPPFRSHFLIIFITSIIKKKPVSWHLRILSLLVNQSKSLSTAMKVQRDPEGFTTKSQRIS